MSPSDDIGLVWFRRDLRLDDNPAWAAATAERGFVVALYVLDQRLLAAAGPYRRRQLVASLQAFDYDLFERTNGGRLVVRSGDPAVIVPDVAERLACGAAWWNADVTPFATRRDEAVRRALEDIDVEVHTSWGTLVHPPGSILTKKGKLSRSFNAFHKVWSTTERAPWPTAGDAVVFPDPAELIPRLDAPAPLPEGESEAQRRLATFVERVERYDEVRDDLAANETSHLSSDLHLGVLSPRAVLDAVGTGGDGRDAFARALAWRDFQAHQLAEHPDLPHREPVARARALAWRDVPAEISAWKGGFTGYPVVDAGMRQLRETGWIPHRVRAIAASFLVKDLLVDWRVGERHFRHLLVDGDLAQNVGGWQWATGVGVDAIPATRVTDPVEGGRRFDPTGAYVRRWVPELAELPDDHVHAPWEAPEDVLAEAGVAIGDTYPAAVVDHQEAKQRFLDAWEATAPDDD